MLSPTLPQAPVRQRKLALLKKIRAAMLKRRRDDSLTRIDCLLAPDKILDELRRLQPQVLTGYPAVLARLAEYMSEAPQHSVRPRLITTVGEVLTPLMRRQITEAFEVPVFNTYGSIEFGYMAWECKESGELHACDDSLLLEVLQDSRPVETGEHGEVVGTNLHNLTIPFLRYRLSDIVTKGSEVCSCGQPFSTIREVEGRRMDFFQLPDGRLVHPYEIERAVRPLIPRIRQYQLEQERENLIIARVVLADSPSPQELAQMQVRLQECVISLLGPEVEFRVEAVSQIPLEPNGKFRVYRSRIAPDGE